MAEYIEREKMLDKLNGIRTAYQRGFDFEAEEVMDRVIEMVKKEPASDVRPERHGHWSDKMVTVSKKNTVGYHEDDYAFGFQCSECDEVLNKTAYCGNCGAKMDGKDGENNEKANRT